MTRRFHAGRGALRAVLVAGLTVVPLGGCYRDVPVMDPVPAGQGRLLVLVNDVGRVALAPLLGPGVRAVRGDLIERTDSSLVLAVSSVQYLDASGPWTTQGQQIEVVRRGVSEVRERRLSRGRTAAALAMVAAALGAFTQIPLDAVGGSGSDPSSGDPKPQ